jgi:nitronate monooxygenase
LGDALAVGAAGIQVGTAFAFCEESGISPELKERAIALSLAGAAKVFTDPVASPTGFPFKVVELEGTISQAAGYAERQRICDLGYLRHLYLRSDGSVGYRCPSEPVEDYVRKGGAIEDTEGRKCVCNGLPASVGLGQVRSESRFELPLVTAGNDVSDIAQFLAPGRMCYRAEDVIRALFHEEKAKAAAAVSPEQVRDSA